MSDRVLGYGIDFGTTNSLVSIAYADRVEVARISSSSSGGEMGQCLPSVVYFDRDEDYRAGEDAILQYVYVAGNSTQCNNCRVGCERSTNDVPLARGQHANIRTSCVDARMASGMKQILALARYPGTDSWGEHFDVEDMVGWVLGALRNETGNGYPVWDLPVVVGVPVEYEEESTGSRAVALDRMRAAAERAGFGNISFLEEPKAALVYEVAAGAETGGDEVCLAVDFGGGTFDAAVSASGVTPWATDAVQGVPVGGEHFDSRLFTQCVAPAMGMTPVLDRFPRLRTRSGAVMGTGDSTFRYELRMAARDRVRGAAMLSQIFERGQVYDLWRAIEKAKIQLSSSPRATIDFRKPGIEVSADVTRADFESAIRDEIGLVRDTMLTVVEQAGIAPEDVSLIVKTGGSSSLPAFNDLLAEVFPNAQVQARPALTTIAEGLAHYIRAEQGALDTKPNRTAAKGSSQQLAPSAQKVRIDEVREAIVELVEMAEDSGAFESETETEEWVAPPPSAAGALKPTSGELEAGSPQTEDRVEPEVATVELHDQPAPADEKPATSGLMAAIKRILGRS